MFKRAMICTALLILAGAQMGLVYALNGDEKSAPEVGQKAPDFKLPYATQEKIQYKAEEGLGLSQYSGKIVLLAFYPADWSPGCTTEMCAFRDTFKDLAEFGVVVLGISGDYVFSHHEWAKHHDLKFALLSDHNHAVAKTYASFDPTLGYNKRTVYVIDGEGVVRFRNLDFKHGDKGNYKALREAIESLKAKAR